MEITSEEIQDWTENIQASQTEMRNYLKTAFNKTFFLVPKFPATADTDELKAEYILEYGLLLNNEKATIEGMDATYRVQLKTTLNNLYQTPSGTVLAEEAKEAIQKLKKGDSDILAELTELSGRMQRRHNTANSIAIEADVNTITNDASYELRPKREVKEIVAVNTDFVRQPTGKNPVVSTYTTETVKPTLSDSFVKLPVFDGRIQEWSAFYMIFKPAVIENAKYDNVMKHNILRNHIKGEAADLIRPFDTDGTQFDDAVKRLMATYGSPEKQYDYLWTKLTRLPAAKESPKSLRHMHNEVYAIVNSLKKQGSIETQNFQSEIKNKIPRSILIEVLKTKPKNTTDLLDALDVIITIEESALRSGQTTESHDTTVFVVKNSQKRDKCKFCNRSNHTTVECKTVRTLEDRKAFIKTNNLCYNCLNAGHRLNECRTQQCRKCNTKHNQAICPRNQNVVRQNYQTNQNSQNYKKDDYQRTNFRNSNHVQNNGNGNHQSHFQRTVPNAQHPQRTQGQGYPQRNQETHNGQKSQQSGQNQQNGYKKPQGQSVPNKSSTKIYQVRSQNTSLMVANTPIVVGDEIEIIPALLDSGADQSFILSSYAEKANMRVLERNLDIDLSVFGREPTPIVSNRVEFKILTNCDENPVIRVEALTVPDITDLFDPVDLTSEDKDYLEKIDSKPVNITRPQKAVALLGCDVFWELVIDGKQKLPSGRFIVPTQIGTVVCGSNGKSTSSMHALITRMKARAEDTMTFTESNLEEFFEIGNIGITEQINDPTNDEMIENFEKTVQFNEQTKRVVVSLPWKEGHKEKLANNRDVALCRLRQRMNSSKGTEAWEKLIENFETMEKSGVIEEVFTDPDSGYYIPYDLVFNQNSNTTKVRTVFDASSKKRGELSLNNALHQGPSLVPELLGIILRTRPWKFLMTGDIEKAFHSVEVNENDRDALRFLWLKDPYGPLTKNNLRVMRFSRTPFGVNCSPSLLTLSIHKGAKHRNVSPHLMNAIETMCYVDNIFILTDDYNELEKLYHELKEFFDSIGMNIREFSLNHPESFLREEDKAENLDNVKMLGYLYDLTNDTFEVKKPELLWENNQLQRLTKQQAVSEITQIFDPTQYFAPLYLQGKLILRSISDHTMKWKDYVSSETVNEIRSYRKKISNSTLQFSRHIERLNNNVPVQIAVFSDASETSYGACIYLQIEKEDMKGQFQTNLLLAKQRIAPKSKTLTIPRLELLGILIAVRLLNYTLKQMQLNVQKIELFSDSTIALAQIKNFSSKKGEKHCIYVENRCREIWTTLENIKKDRAEIEISLSHVPTDQNPADHITRGCDSEEELRETNWFNGPSWLADENDSDHPSKKENNQLMVETPVDDVEITPFAMTVKVKNITERAQRQLNQAPRRPARCSFCQGGHYTTDCKEVNQQDKIMLAKEKRLCILCGNRANHHPTSCHSFKAKNQHLLCRKRACGNRFDIHHKNLCPLGQQAPLAPPAPIENMEEIIDEIDQIN